MRWSENTVRRDWFSHAMRYEHLKMTRIFWLNSVWSWKLHILYTACGVKLVFCFSSEAESAATLCSNVEWHYFCSSYFASLCMKEIHFAHKYMTEMTVSPFCPQKHVILPFSLAQLCKSGSPSLAPALSHSRAIRRCEQPCMLLPPLLWMEKKRLKF